MNRSQEARRYIKAQGWDVERGNNCSNRYGSDDSHEAWYLVSPEQTMVDHRGRGYRTLADAADGLREHLEWFEVMEHNYGVEAVAR